MGQLVDASSVALLLEDSITARMMVLLFWMTYISCSEHMMLLQLSHSWKDSDNVLIHFHVAELVQQDIGAAVYAGDMEASSVANVCSFTFKLCYSANLPRQNCTEIDHILVRRI